MYNPLSARPYDLDEPRSIAPLQLPQDQQEEDPLETEKGKDEKKDWPPREEEGR